jgi:hypothetical protein
MASAKNATVTTTNVKSSMNQFLLSRRSDVISATIRKTDQASFERGLVEAQKPKRQFKGSGVRNT